MVRSVSGVALIGAPCCPWRCCGAFGFGCSAGDPYFAVQSSKIASIHPVVDGRKGLIQDVIIGQWTHNKARSVAPGRLPAQPWSRPKGVGRSC